MPGSCWPILPAAQTLELHAVDLRAGEQVLKLELGLDPGGLAPGPSGTGWDDFTSGWPALRFGPRPWLVIPCSMGRWANRHRGGPQPDPPAGEVFLKERRPLILVVRETPLSLIPSKTWSGRGGGSHDISACPGFYTGPLDLTELARQFAAASWTTWGCRTS